MAIIHILHSILIFIFGKLFFKYGNSSYIIYKINIFIYNISNFEILLFCIIIQFVLLKLSKISTVFKILNI